MRTRIQKLKDEIEGLEIAHGLLPKYVNKHDENRLARIKKEYDEAIRKERGEDEE